MCYWFLAAKSSPRSPVSQSLSPVRACYNAPQDGASGGWCVAGHSCSKQRLSSSSTKYLSNTKPTWYHLIARWAQLAAMIRRAVPFFTRGCTQTGATCHYHREYRHKLFSRIRSSPILAVFWAQLYSIKNAFKLAFCSLLCLSQFELLKHWWDSTEQNGEAEGWRGRVAGWEVE